MAEILPHDFDGIQEYDNPVPTWLAQLFLWTTVFGICYAIYYPSLWFYGGVSEWSSAQQYEQQIEVENARYAPLQAAAQAKALEALKSLSSDPTTLEAGKGVFTVRCAPCHGDGGVGKIGPNLTDADWLYGGEAKDVLESIREGRPKGMPAWKNDLKGDEIQSVTAYVLSLAPQGDTAEAPSAEATPSAESTPAAVATPEVESTPAVEASPVVEETPEPKEDGQ